MRKRQIIVPLSKQSIINLEYDSTNETNQLIYNISEEDFLNLFHSDFFSLINLKYPDILIDDFEEEMIKDEKVLISIIELITKLENGSVSNLLIKRLVFLIEQAIFCKTGIYFYF